MIGGPKDRPVKLQPRSKVRGKEGHMPKSVSLERETLLHIVDALSAANACGLRSEIEQIAFENSLKNAGGLARLSQRAGMVFTERKVYPCDAL